MCTNTAMSFTKSLCRSFFTISHRYSASATFHSIPFDTFVWAIYHTVFCTRAAKHSSKNSVEYVEERSERRGRDRDRERKIHAEYKQKRDYKYYGWLYYVWIECTNLWNLWICYGYGYIAFTRKRWSMMVTVAAAAAAAASTNTNNNTTNTIHIEQQQYNGCKRHSVDVMCAWVKHFFRTIYITCSNTTYDNSQPIPKILKKDLHRIE